MDFAVHRIKLKEGEKKEKYLIPSKGTEKTVEHEGWSDINCNWCARCCHQRIDKETGGVRNKRCSDNQPEYWEESWRREEIHCLSNSSKQR